MIVPEYLASFLIEKSPHVFEFIGISLVGYKMKGQFIEVKVLCKKFAELLSSLQTPFLMFAKMSQNSLIIQQFYMAVTKTETCTSLDRVRGE